MFAREILSITNFYSCCKKIKMNHWSILPVRNMQTFDRTIELHYNNLTKDFQSDIFRLSEFFSSINNEWGSYTHIFLYADIAIKYWSGESIFATEREGDRLNCNFKKVVMYLWYLIMVITRQQLYWHSMFFLANT